MTDEDDDALRWAGDDDLDRPAGARTTTSRASESDEPDEPVPGGRYGPVIGMLTVAALVETVLWVQSVLLGGSALTVGPSDATAVGVLAWALNALERVAGALSPAVWFAATFALTTDPRRRAAVLLLGVVLLVPWPAIVRLL